MITAKFLVVESRENVGSDGKTYRNVTLADPDGDGVFPVFVREDAGPLPPPLQVVDATLRLTGFSKPAHSSRTGKEYVQTTLNGELVKWAAVGKPSAAAA